MDTEGHKDMTPAGGSPKGIDKEPDEQQECKDCHGDRQGRHSIPERGEEGKERDSEHHTQNDVPHPPPVRAAGDNRLDILEIEAGIGFRITVGCHRKQMVVPHPEGAPMADASLFAGKTTICHTEPSTHAVPSP